MLDLLAVSSGTGNTHKKSLTKRQLYTPRLTSPNKMANLNKTLIKDPEQEEEDIETPHNKENNDMSFPCEKCERIFPKKQARALHLNKAHNMKTINYTPGVVRQNSKKHMEVRLSLRCTLCSFMSKTKPILKKHMEVHHKNRMPVEF